MLKVPPNIIKIHIKIFPILISPFLLLFTGTLYSIDKNGILLKPMSRAISMNYIGNNALINFDYNVELHGDTFTAVLGMYV